jgi:PPOX class probable F420-dependent enzyme
MELDQALAWAAERTQGVLITIRRDGRPQSSDISYCVDGDALAISVTADRAKTANMRRDQRVVLHISDRPSWSYVAFDAVAELSPVASQPEDATADALVAYYRRVAGKEHPDWDEYRAAMVAEGRLIVTVRPASAVGQIS